MEPETEKERGKKQQIVKKKEKKTESISFQVLLKVNVRKNRLM